MSAVPAVPGAINVPALTGNEIVAIATSGPQSAQTTTGAIAALSSGGALPTLSFLNTMGGTTLTAAEIVGGTLVRRGLQSAPFTDTLDTYSNILALLPNIQLDEAFNFTYYNMNAFPATITQNGSVIIRPNGVIVPANSWVTFTVLNEASVLLFEPTSAGSNALISGNQYTVVSAGTPLLLTAADIYGAALTVINLAAVLSGAGTVTLPTVASMLPILYNFGDGDNYVLRIINSSSGDFAWTLMTNTGWSLSGTPTIAQNTYRDFIVTLTNSANGTLQQIGTGTTS